MKIIELAGGKGHVKVDDEDFERLSKYKWHMNCGYANNTEVGLMHRFILGVTSSRILVDHKHGDKLDNRKTKLRKCNRGQNGGNAKKPKPRTDRNGPTSKYKGVSAYLRGGEVWWCATLAGVRIGVFRMPEDAARAYDEEARKKYGEFARTNFLTHI